MIHTVKGFSIFNEAEVDVFLELSCFFDDPADVGNLISGSSAFSKSYLPFLGLEWKLTFSSPVATAEFSKFITWPEKDTSIIILLNFKLEITSVVFWKYKWRFSD